MKKLLTSIALSIRTLGILISPPKRPVVPHCHSINALLMHLCDYDKRLHHWVLCWIAYPLRNPGAKMDTAIIVNGSQGSGKGLFFERIVGQLHGGAKLLPTRAFFDAHRLNAFAAETTYAVLDGCPSNRLAGQLKHLVSSNTVMVRRPYESAATELKNTLNLVVISDGDDFLPLGAGSRRFVTIEAPPPHGPALYTDVDFEIKHGGIEAFRKYLQSELAMGDFEPGTLPQPLSAAEISSAWVKAAKGPVRAPASGRQA